MKKHNIFIFLTCITITTAMLGDQEQQPGYWQRFRNWMRGGALYTASAIGDQYTWALEFLAGLSQGQREALKGALIGLTFRDKIGIDQNTLYKMGVGAMQSSALYEVGGAVTYMHHKNIVKKLESLSKEEQIKKLFELHDMYSPKGSNPDEAMLNVVDWILVETLKQ